MAVLGLPVRHYKLSAAWAAEKAARLKLNGRLLSRSPLSSLEELEMLRLGVEGKAAGWRTLRALAVHEYLGDVVGRFGLPTELATWSLVVFVGLSVIASAVGGGALTWLGFRLSPSSRRPPS